MHDVSQLCSDALQATFVVVETLFAFQHLSGIQEHMATRLSDWWRPWGGIGFEQGYLRIRILRSGLLECWLGRFRSEVALEMAIRNC